MSFWCFTENGYFREYDISTRNRKKMPPRTDLKQNNLQVLQSNQLPHKEAILRGGKYTKSKNYL